MIEFNGFPAKMQFTPVPNIVFSSLLPQITDIVELKTLLHIFEILYPKKGIVKYTTYHELMGHAGLVSDIKVSPQEVLPRILETFARKGILLHLPVKLGAEVEDIYLLNTQANKSVVDKIQSGELVLPGLRPEKPVPVNTEEPSDVFTLYEQNIGMLTPLIADELREAEKQYPAGWIKDAIKESVTENKRSWRYIARILEHWSSEGKDDGTHRGNLKKHTDPDKYFKGKYGHMVR
jgi:DNA replication protein